MKIDDEYVLGVKNNNRLLSQGGAVRRDVHQYLLITGRAFYQSAATSCPNLNNLQTVLVGTWGEIPLRRITAFSMVTCISLFSTVEERSKLVKDPAFCSHLFFEKVKITTGRSDF